MSTERKVQKIGMSSLMVTLPKEWVKKVGLKPGDKVRVEMHGNTLIIYPGGIDEPRVEHVDDVAAALIYSALTGRLIETKHNPIVFVRLGAVADAKNIGDKAWVLVMPLDMQAIDLICTSNTSDEAMLAAAALSMLAHAKRGPKGAALLTKHVDCLARGLKSLLNIVREAERR